MSDAMNQPRRQYHSKEEEILDRVRRVETRLTKYMEAQGFDTQVARATWDGRAVAVPSPAISLQEILNAIPSRHVGPVSVCIGDEHLVMLQRPVS